MDNLLIAGVTLSVEAVDLLTLDSVNVADDVVSGDDSFGADSDESFGAESDESFGADSDDSFDARNVALIGCDTETNF